MLASLGTEKSIQADLSLPSELPQSYPPSPVAPDRRIRAGAKGRAVVLHDSFLRTGPVDPFLNPLSEHFEQTLYYSFALADPALIALVKWERADIVIEEMVERRIAPRRRKD